MRTGQREIQGGVIEGRRLPRCVVWQVWQVVGKLAATCFGFVVPWKSFRWQLTQVVVVSV